MSESKCKQCIYYHEPDINTKEKTCNFPWFDHDPIEDLKRACMYDNEDEEE